MLIRSLINAFKCGNTLQSRRSIFTLSAHQCESRCASLYESQVPVVNLEKCRAKPHWHQQGIKIEHQYLNNLNSLSHMSSVKTPVQTSVQTLILYHGQCHDGFAAMVTAYHYYLNLKETTKRIIYFINVNPNEFTSIFDKLSERFGEDPLRKDMEVLSFDVGFTRTNLDFLLSLFPQAHIYDHHQSTLEQFPDVTTRVQKHLHLDLSISGVMLAHNHYFPNQSPSLFQRYIQDRDLLKFELPRSKTITTALYWDLPWTYFKQPQIELKRSQAPELTLVSPYAGIPVPDCTLWLDFMKDDDWFESTYQKGLELELNIAKMMALMRNPHVIQKIGDYQVAVVQCTIFLDEFAETIYANGYYPDYVCLWKYDQIKRKICVSLRRASQNTRIDCSKIAKAMTGGGHPNASGFECSLEQFIKWLGI